jgi:hypothetical protein
MEKNIASNKIRNFKFSINNFLKIILILIFLNYHLTTRAENPKNWKNEQIHNKELFNQIDSLKNIESKLDEYRKQLFVNENRKNYSDNEIRKIIEVENYLRTFQKNFKNTLDAIKAFQSTFSLAVALSEKNKKSSNSIALALTDICSSFSVLQSIPSKEIAISYGKDVGAQQIYLEEIARGVDLQISLIQNYRNACHRSSNPKSWE